MRELSNYITEKLDINNVNLGNEFPLEDGIIAISEFLELNKFERVLDSDAYTDVGDICNAFYERRNKCYMTATDNKWWVRICDTTKGKISKNNPCVFIYYYKKDNLYYLEYPHSPDKSLSREECLEFLNKKFGLK